MNQESWWPGHSPKILLCFTEDSPGGCYNPRCFILEQPETFWSLLHDKSCEVGFKLFSIQGWDNTEHWARCPLCLGWLNKHLIYVHGGSLSLFDNSQLSTPYGWENSQFIKPDNEATLWQQDSGNWKTVPLPICPCPLSLPSVPCDRCQAWI